VADESLKDKLNKKKLLKKQEQGLIPISSETGLVPAEERGLIPKPSESGLPRLKGKPLDYIDTTATDIVKPKQLTGDVTEEFAQSLAAKAKPGISTLKKIARVSPLLAAGAAGAAWLLTDDEKEEAKAMTAVPPSSLPPAAAEKASEDKQAQVEQRYLNDYEKLAQRFNKKLDDLDKSDSEWLRERYEKLDKVKEAAVKQYQKNRNQLQWAQAATMIAQSFIQLAAAFDGANDRGQSVTFDKLDWDRNYNNLLEDYKMTAESAESGFKQDKEIRDADIKTGKEGVRRSYSAAIRDLSQVRAESNKKLKEIEKSDKTDMQKQKMLDKERAKVMLKYKQVDDIMFDLDDGKIKMDKALPKIRKLTGADAAELDKASEEHDAGWWGKLWGEDPDRLKKFIAERKKQELMGLGGLGNPQAAPAPAGSSRKVVNPDDIEGL